MFLTLLMHIAHAAGQQRPNTRGDFLTQIQTMAAQAQDGINFAKQREAEKARENTEKLKREMDAEIRASEQRAEQARMEAERRAAEALRQERAEAEERARAAQQQRERVEAELRHQKAEAEKNAEKLNALQEENLVLSGKFSALQEAQQEQEGNIRRIEAEKDQLSKSYEAERTAGVELNELMTANLAEKEQAIQEAYNNMREIQAEKAQIYAALVRTAEKAIKIQATMTERGQVLKDAGSGLPLIKRLIPEEANLDAQGNSVGTVDKIMTAFTELLSSAPSPMFSPIADPSIFCDAPDAAPVTLDPTSLPAPRVLMDDFQQEGGGLPAPLRASSPNLILQPKSPGGDTKGPQNSPGDDTNSLQKVQKRKVRNQGKENSRNPLGE